MFQNQTGLRNTFKVKWKPVSYKLPGFVLSALLVSSFFLIMPPVAEELCVEVQALDIVSVQMLKTERAQVAGAVAKACCSQKLEGPREHKDSLLFSAE